MSRLWDCMNSTICGVETARRSGRHHPTQRDEHDAEQVEEERDDPEGNPLIELPVLAPRSCAAGRSAGAVAMPSLTRAPPARLPWRLTTRRSTRNVTDDEGAQHDEPQRERHRAVPRERTRLVENRERARNQQDGDDDVEVRHPARKDRIWAVVEVDAHREAEVLHDDRADRRDEEEPRHVVQQADELRVTVGPERGHPPAVVGEDERRRADADADDVGVGEDAARRARCGISGRRSRRTAEPATPRSDCTRITTPRMPVVLSRKNVATSSGRQRRRQRRREDRKQQVGEQRAGPPQAASSTAGFADLWCSSSRPVPVCVCHLGRSISRALLTRRRAVRQV